MPPPYGHFATSPATSLADALSCQGPLRPYDGTAIALYLGHRASVDFDFFSHDSFQPEDLFPRFAFLGGGQVLQSQPDTLTVLVQPQAGSSDTVKVSFFGGLVFGCLHSPMDTDDGVLRLASPQDLLAHKLKVLMQRVEAKDYQDIDALLSSGLDLGAGLSGAKLLFPEFAPQDCLKALTYFKDKTLSVLPEELKRRLIVQTKRVTDLPDVGIYAPSLSGVKGRPYETR